MVRELDFGCFDDSDRLHKWGNNRVTEYSYFKARLETCKLSSPGCTNLGNCCPEPKVEGNSFHIFTNGLTFPQEAMKYPFITDLFSITKTLSTVLQRQSSMSDIWRFVNPFEWFSLKKAFVRHLTSQLCSVDRSIVFSVALIPRNCTKYLVTVKNA